MTLEPTATALAAERIDSTLLAKLEQNLLLTDAGLDKPDELVDADIEFHELITMATGNHALFLACERLGEFLFTAYGTIVEKLGAGLRLLEAHTKIFEAIKAGDADTAREWMQKNFRDFLRGCELAGIPVDEPIRNVNVAMNITSKRELKS
ncbi:MAG: DNA-binding FadR family transcriptional regulator [Candidatus Azotimanducaceae bacterium]